MMARRFRVAEGDSMELSGRAGARRLEIVAVSDGFGFIPFPMPYRNAKTYGVIDGADADLIAPYVAPVGAAAVVAHWSHPAVRSLAGVGLGHARGGRDLRMPNADWYRWMRGRETDRDFVIFDLMLSLTSVLAAIGIANQMLLSLHGRRREIALYRVLGMTAPQVRRLVLLEGGFIGLLGGGLAVLLGVPLGYAAIGALRVVSAFEVDFALPPRYVLFTVLGSVVIAGVASLYPARRAALADAAESVHYDGDRRHAAGHVVVGARRSARRRRGSPRPGPARAPRSRPRRTVSGGEPAAPRSRGSARSPPPAAPARGR